MPDFSTFASIRASRQELYDRESLSDVDRRYLLKEAEESLLAQAQLELLSKGGG